MPVQCPSADNKGLEYTGGRSVTLPMASAVFTGTVLFSTMIFELVDTLAIMRAAPSQYARSAALPAPTPVIFVGVLTLHRPGQHVGCVTSAPITCG